MAMPYRALRASLIALLSAFPACSAFAQALRLDNGLRPRGQTRYEVHKQNTQAAPTQIPTPARAQSVAENADIRIVVKNFRITGASLVPKPVLVKALEPFTGKPVGFAELQKAADVVTDIYRQRGFVASRAYLPQQVLAGDGRAADVEIAVIEGRYGRIRIENASRVPDNMIRDWLGINTGEPVVVSTIERNLLLIEDLPGVHVVSSSFTPGARVGETEYILAVESEPAVTGTATVDNYGLRNTGVTRAGVDVSWQNPSGGADQLSGGVMTTGQGFDTGRISYSLPLGSRGLRGSLSLARTAYTLGEELAALDANGTADTASLFLNYPLVRERSLNNYISLELNSKRLREEVLGTLIANKKGRTATLALTGNEENRVLAKGVSVWQISATTGRLDIDNEDAKLVDAAGPQTRGNFQRANLSLLHEQTLLNPNDGWYLQMSLRGQYASKNLDPSEKTSLGGPTGVRAFPVGEAAGDQSFLSSLELKKRLNWVNGTTVWGSLFYDAGTSKLNAKPYDDSINRRTLKGYGIGLRADYNNKYFINGSVAWVSGEGSTDPREQDKSPRIWVQAGANY